MRGMLLGLGELIADAIGAVLKVVIMPLINIIFDFILTPIIRLLIEIVKYSVGCLLYMISSFLLQLIDFVEILFRALAGLDASGGNTGMSIELSLNGDKGDILIQLIRNPDIQQAFLSMCIVGVFLLVVTTVFQIIKTEYTTEGAKNAKGPIFQKAFKALSNLMLLPILVIMGIVFASQLLGLLDSATKGTGNNPTISGLIFVAAASDAHYKVWEEVREDEEINSGIDLIIYSLADCIEVVINAALGDGENEGNMQQGLRNEGRIEEIEDGFISQKLGYRYYNVMNVMKYYNYANINYMLLLFGSVFVLKSLFFSCFGMVIRLYKCAMLFIIAPAIIGMTPINEGGLGKWRTAFIGQVLSAYGTVMALNLFFIIVRVLLSVDVKFRTDSFGLETGFFTSYFMTALLKAVFVLAGCLLIEKFAKEIGGYFGAEDAMGAGKAMAGEVGDLAMKGVQVAAAVGTGGAALAGKAIQGAKGIAGKLGQSSQAGRAAYSKARESGASRLQALKARKKAATSARKEAFKSNETKYKEIQDQLSPFEQQKAEAQGLVDIENDKIAEQDSIISKLEAESKANGGKLKGPEAAALRKAREEKSKAEGRRDLAKLDIANADSKMGDILTNKDNAKVMEEVEKKQTLKTAKKMDFIAGLHGLGEQGKKNLWGRKYMDTWDKARADGAKYMGDPFAAAHESVEYNKGKKVQDFFHDAPGLKHLVDSRNASGAAIVTRQVVKEANSQILNVASVAGDFGTQIAQAINSTDKSQHGQLWLQLQQKISSLGGDTTIDALKAKYGYNEATGKVSAEAIAGKISFDAKQDLKINFDPKQIEVALNEAMQKGGKPEDIEAAVRSVMEKMGKDGNIALMKMLTDLFNQKIGEINK